jgi:hypothetical protein
MKPSLPVFISFIYRIFQARFASVAVAFGVFVVLATPLLSGCFSKPLQGNATAIQAFNAWHGNAENVNALLNVNLPQAPGMVGLMRLNGEKNTHQLAMLGMQGMGSTNTRWLLIQQEGDVAQAMGKAFASSPTALSTNALKSYSHLKAGKVKKTLTPDGEAVYISQLNNGLQLMTFGAPEAQSLRFFEGQQNATGFSLAGNKQKPWRASEHLGPIISETFQEFENINSEQLVFMNVGGVLRTIAPTEEKKMALPENMWASAAVDKAVQAESGLVKQHAHLLMDVPEVKLTNGVSLDDATMEYLYEGSKAASFTPNAEVDFISVQHVNRYIKKMVMDQLSEDQQNQIKMMNPLLSLLHLNLEKDVIGLFSKRSVVMMDPKGNPTLVLEPQDSKLKTIQSLVTFLGPKSPLGSGLLKGVGNGKDYIQKADFKGQTLLNLNPEIGLPAPLSQLRLYPNSQGIYISDAAFFTTHTPDSLTRLLRFDTNNDVSTPWMQIQMPHVKRVMQGVVSKIPSLDDAQRTKIAGNVVDSPVEAVGMMLNLSSRNKRVVSGGMDVMYKQSVACSPLQLKANPLQQLECSFTAMASQLNATRGLYDVVFAPNLPREVAHSAPSNATPNG